MTQTGRDDTDETQRAGGSVKKSGKDERAERLAAALRANLQRRKQARRTGLDDFDRTESDDRDR